MNKEYTKKEYEAYMRRIDEYIKNAEIILTNLPKFKEVWSKLSFEDWVKWQKGEYK